MINIPLHFFEVENPKLEYNNFINKGIISHSVNHHLFNTLVEGIDLIVECILNVYFWAHFHDIPELLHLHKFHLGFGGSC